MSDIGSAAREYQARGFSVIPLYPRKKTSVINWKKFQTEKASKDQIRSWWRETPDANIAIVTGRVSNRIVIDCDSEEAIQNFLAAYPEARNTRQASTGRGCHFYFKWVNGIRNNMGTKLGRRIDIRSDGGYVVAPPSIHPNGKKYRWLNDNAIKPLPKKLKEHLTASTKTTMRTKKVTNLGGNQMIKEGERNSRLTSIAGAMKRQGANQKTILAALLSENSTNCKPPLPKLEVAQIAQSIDRYPASPNSNELTEAGNARRFAEQHRSDLRYCHKWKSWLVWDGTRWRRDDNGAAMRKAKETSKSIYHDASIAPDKESRDLLAKHGLKTDTATGLLNMLLLAQSESEIAITPADLDKDPWLLTVLNGTLNLKTGKLERHKQADLITKLAPVEYDPTAKCPQWDKFLLHIMHGDKELILFLQQVVGWSLTGDVSNQKLFFFIGKGANGKTTFLKLISDMLGDYAKQAAPDLLLKKHNNTHPTEIADLQGSRFVVAAELDQGGRFAEALLKRLTGGDRIKARLLYENFTEFEPTFKLFIAANHKPSVSDDDAVFRRLRIVPFGVTIPENKQDKDLLGKLRKELPGILAWAVRGCLSWQTQGLIEPEAVKRATHSYQSEMDVIERFLDDRCILERNESVQSSLLFRSFMRWGINTGEEVRLNIREFTARLKNRNFKTKHTNKGNVWVGIRLNEEEDLAA